MYNRIILLGIGYKAWLICRNEDASKKIFVAAGIWSGRQGCNPAGESPVVPVARFRHVVMPHLGRGNHPGDAWCKRPGCPEIIYAQWARDQNRIWEIRLSGIAGRSAETWTMVKVKWARKVKTLKQPSLCLRWRAAFLSRLLFDITLFTGCLFSP